MTLLSIETIRAVADYRAEGYIDDVLASGTVRGNHLAITDEALAALRVKYADHTARNWPAWALVAALFATDADRGLGDTLKRELGGVKTEKFKRWHESVFGLWAPPCGCGKIEEWNGVFPYAPVEGDLTHP